jgi:hypothetical protein
MIVVLVMACDSDHGDPQDGRDYDRGDADAR